MDTLLNPRMTKPVHFYYSNRDAKSVKLMGDFNNWDPNANPMDRGVDGSWWAEVELTHGHHRYLFVVDGVPTLDPHGSGTVSLNDVSKASLIAVS